MLQGHIGLRAGYRLLARSHQADSCRVLGPWAQSFLVGTDCGPYTFPMGIDPLELGLIPAAGDYDLLPLDPLNRPRREEARSLVVTEEQAMAQRAIWRRSFKALLEALPDDAADLERDVYAFSAQGKFHPCLEALSGAILDTWRHDRDPTMLLDEAERDRLHHRVAARALMLLRLEAEPCLLDGDSMRILKDNLPHVLLDRIDLALEEGHVEDATARTLARYRMGLHVPSRHAAALLLRTRRLDIGFLVARRALQPLELLAEIDPAPHGATDQLSAIQATALVRALFAVFETGAARPDWDEACMFWLRARLARTADITLAPFEAGLRWNLAKRLGDRALIQAAVPSASVYDSFQILSIATAALNRTLEQIINELPNRAALGTLT